MDYQIISFQKLNTLYNKCLKSRSLTLFILNYDIQLSKNGLNWTFKFSDKNSSNIVILICAGSFTACTNSKQENKVVHHEYVMKLFQFYEVQLK